MAEDEIKNKNYTKGDLLHIVYMDGKTGDRKAKGHYLTEDDTSITVDIGGYILRIFKSVIIKIEQPKNNSRGRDFDY